LEKCILEKGIQDEQANQMLSRQQRTGFEIHE
jgi:hypothetical protein